MARDLRTGVGTLPATETFLLGGTLPARGHPLSGKRGHRHRSGLWLEGAEPFPSLGNPRLGFRFGLPDEGKHLLNPFKRAYLRG